MNHEVNEIGEEEIKPYQGRSLIASEGKINFIP